MNGRKNGNAAGVGPIGFAFAPGEQVAIGRGQRVPDFLDIVDAEIERLRKAGLGQTRRYPDAHTPGGQFEQCVAAVGIHAVHKAGQQPGRPGAGGKLQFGHHVAQRHVVRIICAHVFGPYQRDCLGGIADEIAAELEQFGIDALHRHVAHGGGLDGGKVKIAGQRCQRPAAVRVGRIAQIAGDQVDLAIARTGVDQAVDQRRKSPHQPSSSSSYPTIASARALR